LDGSIFGYTVKNHRDGGVYIGAKVPVMYRDVIRHEVSDGNYLNVSQFVCDAVKEKLHGDGLLGSGPSNRPVLRTMQR
jgi:hypothetical protein